MRRGAIAAILFISGFVHLFIYFFFSNKKKITIPLNRTLFLKICQLIDWKVPLDAPSTIYVYKRCGIKPLAHTVHTNRQIQLKFSI